jgi:hypothetical protein
MSIPDLIAFSAMSIFIAILLFLVIKLALDNKRLFAQAVQSETDRMMTVIQLEKMQGSNDVEKTDGFLKFVSDSRDWAFQYIENAQKVIEEYDEALSTQDAAKINIAYKKLIELLPKEESNEV